MKYKYNSSWCHTQVIKMPRACYINVKTSWQFEIKFFIVKLLLIW